MAKQWGIPILSEDGSHYGIIIPAVVYADTTEYVQTSFSSAVEFMTYVKSIGTDLQQFYTNPLIADASIDNYVYYSIVNSTVGNYICFRVKHTQYNEYYKLYIYICDSNKTIKVFFSALELACPDNVSRPELYRNQSPQLAIYPYTDIDNTDNITHIGNCRFKSYETDLQTQVLANMYSLSGWFRTTFNNLFGDPTVVPSYPTGGTEPVDVFGGDENNFDGTSDDIPVPDALTGALDNGFVKSYLISAQQLYQFMADITNFNSSTVTDFFNNISLLFNNPIDAIISVKAFCLDFTQFPISNAENVYLMSLQTTATANPIYQQYYKLDIGSIDIDEYFGGFLDYPPYTRITIYLPFIGEQELNVQEVMGATIHLYYMIDFLTGHCVAHLNVTKTAGESTINSDLYQWEGNMACDIPITGQDRHQSVNQWLNGGIGTFAPLLGGLSSVGGGLWGAAGEAWGSSNVGAVRSGSINGQSALMGVRVPYIKIENAIQSMPDNFTELKGMRDGIQHTISELSGYASVMAVNIDNISATDDEKAILKSLLMEGIII